MKCILKRPGGACRFPSGSRIGHVSARLFFRKGPPMTPSKTRKSPQVRIPAYLQDLWNAFKPLAPISRRRLAEKVARGIERWGSQFDQRTAQPRCGDSNLAHQIMEAARVEVLSSVLTPEENILIGYTIELMLLGAWTPAQLKKIHKETRAMLVRLRRENA